MGSGRLVYIFLFTLVVWGLTAWNSAHGAARKATRSRLSLTARDLIHRFPYPEPDMKNARDFENWWFADDRVVLNTFSLGGAPGHSLSHEVTLIGPDATSREDREHDWVGSFRSVLSAQTDSRRFIQISARHAMWSHFYRSGGYYETSGPRSYRAFKNQVRVALEARIVAEKLSFYLPLYLQQSRFTEFRPDARWNGRWRYAAWVAPELMYQQGEKWAVSLFYETDTFVGSDLRRVYLWDSIAEGEVGLRLTYRI
jgi:hypothetical protein